MKIMATLIGSRRACFRGRFALDSASKSTAAQMAVADPSRPGL